MMLLLVFFINLFMAAEAYELLVANLKSKDNQFNEVSCWKDDGIFNEDLCEKREEACEYEGSSTSFNQTELRLNSDMRTFGYRMAYISGLPNKKFQTSSSYSETIIFKEKFPIGANVTIFTKNSRDNVHEYKILKHGIIPQSGHLGAADKNPAIHTVKLIVPKEEKTSLSFEIFNDIINTQTNNIELKLTVGTYPITIWLNNYSGWRQMYSFKLNVRPTPGAPNLPTNKELTIDVKKFVTSDMRLRHPSSMMSWEEDYGTKEKSTKLVFTYPLHDSERIYVTGIKSFSLNDNDSLNLASYFEFKGGEVRVSEEKKNEFLEKLNQFPVYTMKLNGTCTYAKKKALGKNIAVFESPNNDSKSLGDIVVIEGPSEYSISTKFLTPDKQEKDMRVNLMEGSCRNESIPELLHVVRERKDNWVNLGKGPWGEKGWAQVPYEKIESYGEYFNLANLKRVSIKQIEDGIVVIKGQDFSRSEAEINEPGDETSEVNVEFRIEEEKLWDKDGNFIPMVDCSYGC